jgi:hypothetical protein
MDTAAPASDDKSTTGFICDICGKSFDNSRRTGTPSIPATNIRNSGKSQIRHASYCRTKARSAPRSRKRSCLTCTKAKTHCDAMVPACSRCLKRSLFCIYENPQPQQTRTNSSEQLQAHNVVPLVDISLPLDPFLDSSSLLPWTDSESYDLPQDNLHDANSHLLQNSSMFRNHDLLAPTHQGAPPTINGYSLFYNRRFQSESFPFSYQNSSTDYSRVELQNPLGSAVSFRSPRAFEPKRVRHQQLFLNRKYVVVTLSSYPLMMLPGKGMPPFIHPRCNIEESSQHERVTQTSLPRPLATCSGSVAMWSVKNKDNSALIWRAIRTEQERMSEEVDLNCYICCRRKG